MWSTSPSEPSEPSQPSGGTIVPPVLYLPVIDMPDDQGRMFAVRPLTNGRTGLLAYTALDRLAACCGEQQPWVMLPTPELGRVKQAQAFDVVAFDLPVPTSQRSGGRLA